MRCAAGVGERGFSSVDCRAGTLRSYKELDSRLRRNDVSCRGAGGLRPVIPPLLLSWLWRPPARFCFMRADDTPRVLSFVIFLAHQGKREAVETSRASHPASIGGEARIKGVHGLKGSGSVKSKARHGSTDQNKTTCLTASPRANTSNPSLMSSRRSRCVSKRSTGNSPASYIATNRGRSRLGTQEPM